jgi:hypothetical protein
MEFLIGFNPGNFHIEMSGVKQNKIKEGDILVLTSIGAGRAWGSTVIKYYKH